MFSYVERFVALRYLRAKRAEGFVSVITWFSLLGIALGVATLIIVMSVMNGFREELFSRVIGLNGHLNVIAAEGGPLGEYDVLSETLRKLPDVTSVTPTLEAQALLSTGAYAAGAMIRGVKPQDLQNREIIASNIIAGNLADFQDEQVIIGVRMAQKIGLNPGDSLTLISPRGSPTAFGLSPRLKTYTVAAIFEVGMFEYDANFVFLPLESAQKLFRMPDYVTGIDVMIKTPYQPAGSREMVSAALPENAKVNDWQQSNSSFFTALQVERNVMFLILTLIILVAAFNIISSLIMLVKDKGRDIAILRTMGASQDMILNVFFISGASIGIVGTLSGLILGISVANNIETIREWIQMLSGTDLFSAEIYFLSKLPSKIDWQEVTVVSTMSLLLSFLATLYPAWRASKIEPVEALRYE